MRKLLLLLLVSPLFAQEPVPLTPAQADHLEVARLNALRINDELQNALREFYRRCDEIKKETKSPDTTVCDITTGKVTRPPAPKPPQQPTPTPTPEPKK